MIPKFNPYSFSSINFTPKSQQPSGVGLRTGNFNSVYSTTKQDTPEKPMLDRFGNVMDSGLIAPLTQLGDSLLTDNTIYDKNDFASIENVGGTAVGNASHQLANAAIQSGNPKAMAAAGAVKAGTDFTEALRYVAANPDRNSPEIDRQTFDYNTDAMGNVSYGGLGAQHDQLEELDRNARAIDTAPKAKDYGWSSAILTPLTLGAGIRRNKSARKRRVMDQVREQQREFANKQNMFNRAKYTADMGMADERNKRAQARRFLGYA